MHKVYFYGSTRIVCGENSLKPENIKKRNQLIGFYGVEDNTEFSTLGEICLNMTNSSGIPCGETGTLYPLHNITIVPFRYEWCLQGREDIIVKHIEDVIEANEKYVKSTEVSFPLFMLKEATREGWNLLGKHTQPDWWMSNFDGPSARDRELSFARQWCCFGHYYLPIIRTALENHGYTPQTQNLGLLSNLRNEVFIKYDGTTLEICADAGL